MAGAALRAIVHPIADVFIVVSLIGIRIVVECSFHEFLHIGVSSVSFAGNLCTMIFVLYV
jgi:hypothetical protein